MNASCRWIVTGASGFVGSHVVRALLARGHAVTAVARDAARAARHDWFTRVRFVAADVYEPLADLARHLRCRPVPCAPRIARPA